MITDNFNKFSYTFFFFFFNLGWFFVSADLKASRGSRLYFEAPEAALADRKLQNGCMFSGESGKILQNIGWFRGVCGGLYCEAVFLVCTNTALCWQMPELIINWLL